MTKIYDLLIRLTRADIAFYLLPPLMIVLTVGTLAQAEMGLYAAHKTFFAAPVFWWGPVPLPGGYLLIALLSAHLALKFVLQSKWSWEKSGIILAHFGALVLLIGGLFTALYAREGYMIIPEGKQTPFVQDYVDKTLYLFAEKDAPLTLSFDALKNRQTAIAGVPFTLQVKNICANCALLKRAETPQAFAADLDLRGMARFMAVTPKQSEKEPEENLSGLSFEIRGLDDDQDGLYVAFEGMPKAIELSDADRRYQIIYGKTQYELPFALKLTKFEKKTYPGTAMARGYSSDITVLDGALEWPVRIAMNAPLRYKGYTFYQSSFERREDGTYTILSVVENRGRLLPYISSVLIAAGLLLHIFIVLRKRGTP